MNNLTPEEERLQRSLSGSQKIHGIKMGLLTLTLHKSKIILKRYYCAPEALGT